MSVQFVIGSSGSGKSTYLYDRVIGESMKYPKKRYFYIVPEQFTMSTQRTFVARHPKHTIMNIDVLSFHRLAYRIFTELGKDDVAILDDTGKNLILHRIAHENLDKFSVLGRKLQNPGYIDEMKSLLSELTQYHISVEELRGMADTKGMPPVFSKKVDEIAFMYESFLSYIKDSHITSEQILEELAKVLPKSELVKDAVFVFDGFTGFTPLQNDVVKALMPLADEMLFSVIMDANEAGFSSVEEEDLFAMSKKYIQKVSLMAKETNVEIKDSIRLELRDTSRFTKDSTFGFLESHIFRDGGEIYEKKTDDIAIVRLDNPREELEYCASEIHRRTTCTEGESTSDLRYSQIAILCGDVATYKDYVDEIFSKYDIPVFTDATLELSYQPAVEFVLSFLEMVDSNFTYESVIHFLRTGVLDFDLEALDLFDSYLYRSGIRGWKKYQHTFTVHPKEFDEEELLSVNELRKALVESIAPAVEIFSKKGSVTAKSEAFRQLFAIFRIEEKMEQKSKKKLELGDEERASEYAQIYGLICDLLEKLDSILGDEVVDVREYSDLLRAGFKGVKIGIIPPLMDAVVFGDLERSRLENTKVIFLIGAVDGMIPKVSDSAGILSQNERELLKAADYELAPTVRERSFMQKFYLYQMLTKAGEKLIVTYSRLDKDGASCRKSYLIPTLMELFPTLEIQLLDGASSTKPQLVTYHQCKNRLIELSRRLTERGSLDEDVAEFRSLLLFFSNCYPADLQRILDGVFYTYEGNRIASAIHREFMGDALYVSVSKLENYARCAYRYFLEYDLRLKERKEHAFEMADVGNLYHEALARFSNHMEKEDAWFTASDEQVVDFLDTSLRETFETMEKTETFDEAREVYLLHRLRGTMLRTVWALMKQVRQGSFRPKHFEVSLSEISSVSQLTYEMENGSKLILDGKIDRVDTFENEDTMYVKIIDYKSGDNSIDFASLYYGLQIQLVYYLKEAVEGLQNSHPDKEVLPGAMLYYHIDDPIIKTEDSGKDIETEILRQLRPSGLINDSTDNISAMDHDTLEPDFSDSLVARFKKKKDGDFDAYSQVLSPERFGLLSEFIEKKVLSAGSRILSGEISAHPYKRKDKSGCDYCPYHSVCGFDLSINGFDYNKCNLDLKKDDFFERISEE